MRSSRWTCITQAGTPFALSLIMKTPFSQIVSLLDSDSTVDQVLADALLSVQDETAKRFVIDGQTVWARSYELAVLMVRS